MLGIISSVFPRIYLACLWINAASAAVVPVLFCSMAGKQRLFRGFFSLTVFVPQKFEGCEEDI